MCETSKLPSAPLRAPNRHSAANRSAPQETTPNARSAKFYRTQQNPAKSDRNSCAHARELPQPPPSFPRRRESPSCTTRVIPAKAGIPFSRHVLRPGHSGLDASLGIAVPSPSCQQIERNRFGVFSLGRGRALRLLVGDALLSGISHIMAPQHLDNILE